jgi:hypothetical protein
MDNDAYRSGLYRTPQTIKARSNRLSRVRHFVRVMWTAKTSRYGRTEDCLRCGHPILDGMYCFRCGHVRPRATKRPSRRSVFSDWFKAR